MLHFIFITETQTTGPKDVCVATRTRRWDAIRLAKSCEKVESYIMNQQDQIIWQSWAQPRATWDNSDGRTIAQKI